MKEWLLEPGVLDRHSFAYQHVVVLVVECVDVKEEHLCVVMGANHVLKG